MYLGVKKKVVLLSNRKDCSELGPRIKSVSNHMWWSCCSSKGDKQVHTHIASHIYVTYISHARLACTLLYFEHIIPLYNAAVAQNVCHFSMDNAHGYSRLNGFMFVG